MQMAIQARHRKHDKWIIAYKNKKISSREILN